MKKEAPIQTIVCRSPEPNKACVGSPGLLALPGGRLIATTDTLTPWPAELLPGKPEEKKTIYGWPTTAQVYLSDDHGESWRRIRGFPFMHSRPFRAGKSIYILGQDTDLVITRSDDDGETWSEVCALTQGEKWHQAPSNVWYANGCVYIVMERYTSWDCVGWAPSTLAPVLMRAPVDADLTRRESWTFATELVFRDAVNVQDAALFGMPMYDVPRAAPLTLMPGRDCAPWGWLETNVVQIMDPNHIWYDETGHTFHLFMRAHTAHTNIACMLKVVEQEDGSMVTQFEHAPSGAKWFYLPWPGGQMKFHMLYDEQTKTYWLLSSQSTDSMIRPDRMPANRFGLPDNERHRLQLHFSKNCVDWCFAALVDMGDTALEARHYASMCIHGDDLCILSRSGDTEAESAHNTDLITFHTIQDFRRLIY